MKGAEGALETEATLNFGCRDLAKLHEGRRSKTKVGYENPVHHTVCGQLYRFYKAWGEGSGFAPLLSGDPTRYQASPPRNTTNSIGASPATLFKQYAGNYKRGQVNMDTWKGLKQPICILLTIQPLKLADLRKMNLR